MAEEIERKFFIHSPTDVQRLWERLAFATQKVLIKQGYLNTDGPTTRVRIADQPATLTIKGKRNKNAELSRRSLEIIDSLRESVLDAVKEENHEDHH